VATPYEREIEELLKSLSDFGPRETPAQRFQRLARQRWRGFLQRLRDLPRTVPADQLMLAALLFVVAAYFMRLVIPGAARFVGLAGVILFILAFAFSFQQFFGRSRGQTRWRGRPVQMSSYQHYQPTLLDKFFFWIRRRMRGY
jgi:hypothetical protein